LSPEDYARLLVEVEAVQLRTNPEDWFTWTSGERAPIYCDNRRLISYPKARARIAEGLADAIRIRFPECEVIAGTATAGIPHAAWVAERLERPMVYVRASSKDHGLKRKVEGRPLRGERVVLVEDLISFGGTACTAVEALGAEGGKVIGVQGIFSYGFPTATRRLEEAGVSWQTLTNYDALLACLDLDEATRRVLLEWRAR
jgi:orotate phosphoribosyltransferase